MRAGSAAERAARASSGIIRPRSTGEWPSGKAPDSGSGDRRFESFLASQTTTTTGRTIQVKHNYMVTGEDAIPRTSSGAYQQFLPKRPEDGEQ